jgi:Flp pilus assembly pilin Flp
MAGVSKFLNRLPWAGHDRRGVTSAEYAILAVGVVIVVGGAIRAFSLDNPMTYAGSALTNGQSSLSADVR